MIHSITPERACKPETDVRKCAGVIFDATDIDYLVRTFDLSQLKAELHRAEVELAVCRQHEATGSPDQVYWAGYSAALRLSVSIAQTCASTVTPRFARHQPKMPIGRNSRRTERADVVKERLPRAADVRSGTDILEVIGGHVRLSKSGKNLRGLCPFHSEKNPSFTVYPDQQRWYCYGCCKGGDVFTFIQLTHALDFREAVRYLAGER